VTVCVASSLAKSLIVAHDVRLTGPVYTPRKHPEGIKPQDFAVFASILPECKYDLVKAFQKSGHAAVIAAMAPMTHLRSAWHRSALLFRLR
jgi:hypothetical protein